MVYECRNSTDLHHNPELVTIADKDESFSFDIEQMSY